MKKLHRTDLYGWSIFNEERNIDFHGTLWVHKQGNLLIDPLPLTEHDRKHLESLGGAYHVLITNSDHIRDTEAVCEWSGATCGGPAGEKESFPIECSEWLDEGDEPLPGLKVFALQGSKTPGELALLLEDSTLITGDLIRAHEGGRLCMLPDIKLRDRSLARESVRRISSLKGIDGVIPGDGWPVFTRGGEALTRLAGEI